MKPTIQQFIEQEISPSATLRTILLFGRNVSTYKFALAEALLKAKPSTALDYTDLRDDFLQALFRHYQQNPHQYQSGSNALTRAFDVYQQEGNWEQVLQTAERYIYNNVFDAFHNVGGASIKESHQLFEHDKSQKRIVLTDNLHRLMEDATLCEQLLKENQSRWTIVEEAWKHKLSPNMLVFDTDQNIYSVADGQERVNLRSAVDVLLPYQHGRCFYCNKPLNVLAGVHEYDFPDVDHVIPFSAFSHQGFLAEINPNGIWNLVIACHECNRGVLGKFDAPPDAVFYARLIERNVLFTQEHRHSLKHTMLLSIGAANHVEVRRKMQAFRSYIDLVVGWQPKHIYDE